MELQELKNSTGIGITVGKLPYLYILMKWQAKESRKGFRSKKVEKYL